MKAEEEENKTAAAEEPLGVLDAQVISMRLLRLDPPKKKTRAKTDASTEYLLRLAKPQMLYVQQGQNAVAGDAMFARVVNKEPTYSAPVPFSGSCQARLPPIRPGFGYGGALRARATIGCTSTPTETVT